MKAVSNATPLRYLIAIEQDHLLGQLFEKVLVPLGVHEELTDSRTPEIVRPPRRVAPEPPRRRMRNVIAKFSWQHSGCRSAVACVAGSKNAQKVVSCER